MEVLLVLLALAIPVAGVAGFVMALRLRGRAEALEQRLGALEARFAGLIRPGAAEAPEPMPEVAIVPLSLDAESPARVETAPEVPPPTPVPVSAPAQPGADLEARFGTRWTVWVGGVALALGGLFLVRYSIEQGLLGPTARVVAGALFALALIAAGEWLRRRETAPTMPGLSSAHVPGVLTAAGTSTAFATAYAAYALYGLLGPAAAFATLGVIAVATMAAATLHGPALAALGLVAALVSPLLVTSNVPQLWPVVLYLAFVVLAAYGVARLRRWRWLAIAAASGAVLWLPLLILGGAGGIGALMAHVVAQTLLAGAFLVADVHRGEADAAARVDRFASAVLLAFALLTVGVTTLPGIGAARPFFAAAVALLLLGFGVRFPAAAAGAAQAALIAAGTLAVWPVREQIAAEAATVLPDPLGNAPPPRALGLFLGFGVATAAVIAGVSLLRLARGRALPLATAAWFAAAATAGPLAVLVVSYWRVTALGQSLPFALAAGGLALALAFAAAWLRRQESDALDALRLGTGATAAGAVSALALGLTFALDRGMLTVAFALSALGTAWVARRTGIGALRFVVGALGVIVLGRLVWDPTIVGGDPGRTPIVNWLLWGYGVPALAFLAASRLLAEGGRDRVVRLVESLGIAFAALLVFFEIRHALQGGDPLAPVTDHLELGLQATASLLFALVLVRTDRERPDPVYRVASYVFGAVTLWICAVGLALGVNPLFTGEPILGGPVFNSLLPAYLMPALLAAWLAWSAQGVRPGPYVGAAAGLALALHLLYTALAIRRVFQGPIIDEALATGQGEQWSYSLALLLSGVVLLGFGFARDMRLARLASSGYILLAIVKVFLIDLASLEGVMRALSFIGLGLALVGIGFAYQKLLVRPAPSPAA